MGNITRLNFNMQTFLHCLVPEQVLHMLQEGVKPEVTVVRPKFIRIDSREIQDIADQEVQECKVLPVFLNHLICKRIFICNLWLNDLVVQDQAVQWSFKIVRHAREENVFELNLQLLFLRLLHRGYVYKQEDLT
jgi:hypothetical protein